MAWEGLIQVNGRVSLLVGFVARKLGLCSYYAERHGLIVTYL